MHRVLPIVIVTAATVLLAACGGGGGGSSRIPVPVPSSAPGGGGGLTASATAAAQTVQSLFATIGHTNANADLAALAAKMKASGAFSSAVVSPGGISAELPDGTPFLVFGDRLDDPSATGTASVARAASSASRAPRALNPMPHVVAFIVTQTDTSGVFTPDDQRTIATAFTEAGFSEPPYATYVADVSLETIAGLRNVDLLDVVTHGIVATDKNGRNPYYVWLSDTSIDPTSERTYATDIAARRVISAVYVARNRRHWEPNFAFTPAFLTSNANFFNSGALVVNQSCNGQHPDVAGDVQATLRTAGVGRYFGWSSFVDGDDADETDAFLYDRLLGERSSTLAKFVTQRSPPQRPFPLDDVQGAIMQETRSGPLRTSATETYADSTPLNPPARFVISDFGRAWFVGAPIFYALPSIATMQIVETPSGGTLTIAGRFPSNAGTVEVVDGATTLTLTPTSWSQTSVVATLPVSGPGSKGLIDVRSAEGIASNAVPLTQWPGSFNSVQNDQFTVLNSVAGSGSGSIAVAYTVNVRADVHPTVPAIDTTPAPQSLAFAQPEGDSTAQISSLTGTFTTEDGQYTAFFGLAPASAPLPPAVPPAYGSYFGFGTVAGQSPPCDTANVFCPAIGYIAVNAATCWDNGDSLCSSALWTPSGIFGSPAFRNDGLLKLTMDPVSYAISVTSGTASGDDKNFEGGGRRTTGTASGSFGAPVSPPTGMLPSSARRSPRR